jgi:hypothetical protein
LPVSDINAGRDYENLRKVGQTKGYFNRITKFATGKPDAHVYEVVETRDRAAA